MIRWKSCNSNVTHYKSSPKVSQSNSSIINILLIYFTRDSPARLLKAHVKYLNLCALFTRAQCGIKYCIKSYTFTVYFVVGFAIYFSYAVSHSVILCLTLLEVKSFALKNNENEG